MTWSSNALTGGRWVVRGGIKVWRYYPRPVVPMPPPKPVAPLPLDAHPTDLIQLAADHFHVNPLDILARGRRGDANIADAGHVARWLLRETGLTVVAIGKIVGRDHSTVTVSIQRVEASPALHSVARSLREIAAGERGENAA